MNFLHERPFLPNLPFISSCVEITLLREESAHTFEF